MKEHKIKLTTDNKKNTNVWYIYQFDKIDFAITGINYIFNYIQINSFFLNSNNISQYYCFFFVLFF